MPRLFSFGFVSLLACLAVGCGVSSEVLRKELDKARAEQGQALSVQKTETANAIQEIRKEAKASHADLDTRVDQLRGRADDAFARLDQIESGLKALTEEVQNRILDIDRSVAGRTEAIESKLAGRIEADRQELEEAFVGVRQELENVLTGMTEVRTRVAENTRSILSTREDVDKSNAALVQYSEAVNEMRRRIDRAIDRYRQNLLLEKRLLMERGVSVDQALKEIDAAAPVRPPSGDTPPPPPEEGEGK